MTEIFLAVVGAHLSEMPLNHELRQLNARLDRASLTAPHYKLYALDTQPPKPGLFRVAEGQGKPIAVEIWRMPVCEFGAFVANVPAPLSIGSVQLSDSTSVKGFLVEAYAVRNAHDISAFGGWRAFIASIS